MRYESKIFLLGLLLFSAVAAQSDGSQYIDLVANPPYPYTSDVWGYIDSSGHEFAVFGVYDGVVILDISTDPANPVETAYIAGPNTDWRDLKTHGNYLYVTNESGGGLAIIDLSDPWQPVLATRDSTFFQQAHNLYIADGYAYIVGSGTPGILILDLANPVNPVWAGSWTTAGIHDLYVKNDTLYACAIIGATCTFWMFRTSPIFRPWLSWITTLMDLIPSGLLTIPALSSLWMKRKAATSSFGMPWIMPILRWRGNMKSATTDPYITPSLRETCYLSPIMFMAPGS
ncbi:MAG: hypothetical protein IIA60_13025 [Candidatus Marinimicrobia bacterium]|nr:hypothetical protein [Candidatus Neomarinimicrobiota bacterium]